MPKPRLRLVHVSTSLASLVAAVLAGVVGLVGLGAASSSAAPAASTAASAGRAAPLFSIAGPHWVMSPNGDGKRDKVRMAIRFERRATVSVSVLLQDRRGAKRIVRPVSLGERRAGKVVHWSWRGRPDGSRRAVPDDYYTVRVAGRTRDGDRYVRKVGVLVDTVFRPHRLIVDAKTLYPRSTEVHDQLGFGFADPAGHRSFDDVRKGVLRITKRNGKVVYSSGPRAWRGARYPITWDGVNDNGATVPSGTYFATVRGKDAAQNSGRTSRVRLRVSDKKLTVQSETRTTAPDATFIGTYTCSGRFPSCEEDDLDACGSVTPGTVYPQAGSLSYRSRSTCAGTWYDYVKGYHSLDDLVDAPRGLVVTKVVMRGRPTGAGETDTAQLSVANPAARQRWYSATSPATAEESLTTVAVEPLDLQELVHAPATGWVVTTRGDDSFDVADFTVEYSYLVPRSGGAAEARL